ncbi:MAG: alcohol dehydrogenase catalytic domain-containing protein [Nitrospinae bacterium]|nr:alcohol dehydrogenase catalytic domain-containing protein [Nitrospinota bacterium]
MKAAVFCGPGDIRLREVADPLVGPDDLVIRVKVCGICGTDLHGYREGLFVTPGQIMGHEFSGQVAEVGAQVSGFNVGDRVAAIPLVPCYRCERCEQGNYHLCVDSLRTNLAYGQPGAFAEYVKIPKPGKLPTIFPLPNEVSDEEGALVEPLSVALRCLARAQPAPGDTVLVLGAGILGQLTAQVFRVMGGSKVVVADVSERRLTAAQELGATGIIYAGREDTVQAMRRLTADAALGLGRPGIVVDFAGIPTTFAQALRIVRPGGKVMVPALYEQRVEFDPSIIAQKDLQVIGSIGYLTEPAKAVELLGAHRVQVRPLITHEFPLDHISEAFAVAIQPEVSVKVVVRSS